MKSFTSMIVLLIFAVALAPTSLSKIKEIPLPGSDDIDNYFVKNLERFKYSGWGDGDRLYIRRIESLPTYKDLFNSYRIFQVDSELVFLEKPFLPSGGSRGYFATNGKEILYLNRSNVDNIEALFKDDNIQIETLNPETFCDFLSRTLLTNGASSYCVISSVSVINFFYKRNKDEGYEINDAELNKIKDDIHPPKISGDKESGWEIEFCSWGGWMHDVGKVSRHLLNISNQYKIQHTEEILTTHVFSKVPNIMY